jgi:hypothetical protein
MLSKLWQMQKEKYCVTSHVKSKTENFKYSENKTMITMDIGEE